MNISSDSLIRWLLFAAALCLTGPASGQTPPGFFDLQQSQVFPMGMTAVLTNFTDEAEEPEQPAASVPALVALRLRHGSALLAEGLFAEATEEFTRALRTDPKNKDARLGLGTVHVANGRFAEALAILEPMLAEFPRDAALRNNVAWALISHPGATPEQLQKAIELARQAVTLKPADANCWSTLAEGYYRSGDFQTAQESLNAALRAVNVAPLPEAQMRDLYRQRGRIEAAGAVPLME